MGKELRNACPRRSHARWKAARGRPDTVRLVLAAEKGRLADLLPLRQLRDIKISIRVEAFGAPEMNLYAAWCGRALALSHARSGSSALLSGYMGKKSDAFEQALASFSVAYADQNEKDHAALKRAIRAGKIKAQYEEEK